MSTVALEPRPRSALAIAALGVAALLGSVPFGEQAIAAGSVALFACSTLALLETRGRLLSWTTALVSFLALIWLVPIRLYRFPIDLSFSLEPYRVALLALAIVLVVWIWRGKGQLELVGAAVPLVVLVAVAILTQIQNYSSLNALRGDDVAFKSLSYFLGFVVVFVLVASVTRDRAIADRLVAALVLGATAIALLSIYEGRTGYNPFDRLDGWIPALEKVRDPTFELRGGNVRVHGSAQHPIALAVALGMAVPLALYLASSARSVASRRWWAVSALVIVSGIASTISRTSIVMLAAMLAIGLALRGREIARFWPALLLLPVVIHFAAPGALGGIYKALSPTGGLSTELQGRAGETGSGRFADIAPGLELWQRAPLVGHGLGSQLTAPSQDASPIRGAPIIFDNQYMSTLVSMGAVGFLAVLAFVWGNAVRLFVRARPRGTRENLVAACCVATVGFAAAMLVFDAFAFVQATLMLFVIVAIGLRVSQMPPFDPPSRTEGSPA